MRTICLLSLFILCAFLVSFEGGKDDKTPPGTVRLKPGLYIDQTEISNMNWREYYYWVGTHEPEKLDQILPDTLVWSKSIDLYTGLPYNDPFQLSENYFRDPHFNDYPAVGLSYEQAIAFCKWRSDRVNEFYQREPSKNPFKGKKVRYRLPTEQEWEYAASNNLNVTTYPFGMKELINKKGRYLVNTKEGVFSRTTNQFWAHYLVPDTFFDENKLGLYHIIGNVSEMIAEKGKAKGGNYTLPTDSCAVSMVQVYEKPTSWLGFRCVCEVVD